MKASLPGLEVQYKHEILASTKHIFFLLEPLDEAVILWHDASGCQVSPGQISE